jgi:GH25 family lysozyme M1 (1,4-beta-N-acetylmuramidase)
MTPNKPIVIDIYHGDNVIDFAAVRAAGIVGVIHKASQGAGIVDTSYATRRKLALAAGLRWGAYHFMSLEDGAAQAGHFLSVADADADTLVALDWENVGAAEPSAHLARAFLEVIQDKLNRRAKIYSGNVAKEQVSGKDAFFGAHDLWLCQYGAAWKVQASWSRPWLWQNNGDNYGPGPHRIPGIGGLCDNNCLIDPMTADDLAQGWAA